MVKFCRVPWPSVAFMHKYVTMRLDFTMAFRRFLISFIFCIFIFINCASSELIRFENNIQNMSNSELINCY